MDKKSFFLAGVLVLAVLLLTACSGTETPTPSPAPTQAPSVSTVAPSNPSKPVGQSPSPFEAKSSAGGSVTVDVQPTALEVGKPVAFDIAMNTHSVDLSDDMTKISTLRDDAGKEYKPTAWEGGEPGGHHRSGTLKFAVLASKSKFVELVIRGLASVPERVFRWDVP